MVRQTGSLDEPAICPPPSAGGLKRAIPPGGITLPTLVAIQGATKIDMSNLREPVSTEFCPVPLASLGLPAGPRGQASTPWDPAGPQMFQATMEGS